MAADLNAALHFRRPAFSLAMELTVPAAGITALVGPSGCGKTTLLRLLAGLETPEAGFVHLGERVWFDSARRIDLAPRHRRAGLLFQDYALFPHLSVAGNVGYGLPRGPDRAARIDAWLDRLHLCELAGRRPAALSGGQRQRTALARALAADPSVLLLDEPFSAVDCALRQTLRLLLRETVADAGIPVVLVTHDLEDVRLVADRVGVVVAGGLRRFGETAAVFADPGDAEVARVLGWQNILPVGDWDGVAVGGAWGRLRIAAPFVPRRPEAVAILPDGPRFSEDRAADRPGDQALPVEVARVVELGGQRALICRLADRSLLRIHLAKDAHFPAVGTPARLVVPGSAIVLLPTPAEATG
ncbi:ABC-type spermidine/putrescine transport system, ATPase component [Thioflavicoccus mobilis 8321]|uniref:ABC-type spermidine/putrescine transport system, ATPase component n=1 Tax=Thioflavicoccus mobilis 8321 TaxID=765912 RepID=L0H2H9_9GAMM|nr:ABC-type spermidine/putrescine transport system, ATPase component [Thioflavicoccus mobilis 8321]